MSNLIVYLLEASVVLVLLYALYVVLLSQETFFSFNRFFLLAILAFSFLFPCLRFDVSSSEDSVINQPIETLSNIRISYYDALEAWSFEGTRNAAVTEITHGNSANEPLSTQRLLLTLLLAIYGIGLVAVLFRLAWLYAGIRRLKASSQHLLIRGLTVVEVSQPIAPFSFLRSVFVPTDLVQSKDFDQILAHERTHVRQGHSIDLIVVQLLAAGLWFNPVVWRLIKSLKTTHEYIADKKMIDQGYSFVQYQTLLLRQLISNHSYGLVHHFNISFTKKRITMMNAEKSGWAGKAKVALVLSAVAVFSLVLVQCNSNLEEQVLRESQASSVAEISREIALPVLPEKGHYVNHDLSEALHLTIANDRVAINGDIVEVDAIASVLDKETTEGEVVVAHIDRAQSMSLVRDVQEKFREADRLKFLYVGQTSAGELVKTPFLLPPDPENKSGEHPPAIDDQYARENNIDLLKLDLGDDAESANQQIVYDFVKGQMAEQKSNYVVSARFSDDDTYDAYLVNLFYIKEAFYQIYDERARAMFGENFDNVYKNKSSVDKYKKIYDAVRQGVPMAISIAEG